jgi:hypothetical protein
MKLATTLLGALALLCVLSVSARAADKEVTLKGKIACAKCELKLRCISKCTTCIKVKEGDKEVIYLFLDKGNKEDYHEAVCGGGQKEGTVTGTVIEKDGQKWIKPKKVEYAGGAAKGAVMADPMPAPAVAARGRCCCCCCGR